MIVTISGTIGSGKTSVAKLVAELGYRFYSVGDLMGELAKERGMTLLELSKSAESDRSVDEELDRRQVALGRDDNIVMDSRLGFHFLPNSKKIFLSVTPETGAKRISAIKREDEKENVSYEATLAGIKKRLASESRRYRQFYGIEDFRDPKNYDLVIDTSDITIEETASMVLRYLHSKGK
jgi:CMP/dCMP kinase